MKTTNIEINQDWFYHQINIENFKDIMTSREIKPPIQLNPLSEIDIETANGPFYISLAKKTNLIYDSSYNQFIRDHYALIIDNIKTKKAYRMEDATLFLSTKLLRMFLPIRFSNWKDEYQTRKSISLDKVIGIKIPQKERRYYISKNQCVDFFLQVMEDTNTYFPFIDTEEQVQINPMDIEEYIKKR